MLCTGILGGINASSNQTSVFYSQIKAPLSVTMACDPPLNLLLELFHCSSILIFSSSFLCLLSCCKRKASATCLSAFAASRFAAFCRCFFVAASSAAVVLLPVKEVLVGFSEGIR